MIYKEIGWHNWIKLDNNLGYYCVKHTDGALAYYKDDKHHREDGAALIFLDGHKQYHLNGKFYGDENDHTDESWIRFVKLKYFI